jgi:transposase
LYKERNEEKRQDYLDKLLKIPEKDRVYVDETGFQTFLTTLYGYAKRGCRLFAEKPGRKFQRLNVLAAYVNNEIIAPLIYSENTNTKVFNDWIKFHLCPALHPGQTVIMDNASFHKSKETIELIESAKCNVLFLAPYSPDLNPIENFWGTLKGRVRIVSKYLSSLKDVIRECLIKTCDEILGKAHSECT